MYENEYNATRLLHDKLSKQTEVSHTRTHARTQTHMKQCKYVIFTYLKAENTLELILCDVYVCIYTHIHTHFLMD